MPYPSPPDIVTSYTAVEQGLGNGTFPGQEVDVDLAALRASITSTIEFLKTSLRSDGRLANGSVSSDTLASSLIIGFDPPVVWATATAYTTRSTVFQGFGFYLCTVAHTSGTFATDLASGRWVLLADLTPPGGALIAANNLSDLANVGNARANLGLGSMATANSGTGPAQHRTNLQNEAVFQPLDAELTAIAGLPSAANTLPYFTGTGSAALTGLTAAGRAILDDADAAAQLVTLGIGGDIPALEALASTGIAVRTAANTWATRTITAGSGISITNGDGAAGNIVVAATGGGTVTDAMLDTGAATAAGTTWVGLRTAGLGAGAVGSYAFLTFNTPVAAAAGTTHAGSGLAYSNANASAPTGTPSGTWQLMGRTSSASALTSTSLFLRIS